MNKSKELLAGCIQRKRMALMLGYQYLFGESIEGEKTIYDKWASDEIQPSSKEGKKVMKAIMKVELDERQLATLQDQYQHCIYKEVENMK